MIGHRVLPNYKPKDPVKAKDLTALRDEVRRLGQIHGSGGVRVASNAAGITIAATPGITGFWASITDQGDAGYYSWGALDFDKDGNVTVSTSDTGSYGDDSGYAMEIFGSQYVLLDEYVWLGPKKDYYVFSYSPGVKIANLALGNTITSQSSGNMTVQWYSTPFTVSDTDSILVYNWTGGTLSAGTYTIGYSQSDGVWFVISGDCGA